MLRTSSFRAGFKRSLLSAEREWVAFVIKEMAFVAVLTTFLWSNEDSDSFWHFKVSFAICKIAEVAKLIDFWMSDNLLSTLLWYGRIFRFWATASLSFGTLTNSQLFGMSSLSAILLTTRDFRDSSSQYHFAISANWQDMAGPAFVETRLLLIFSPKMSWVSTLWSLTFELVSLTWEEILWFSVTAGGLWWHSHFHCHHQYQTEMQQEIWGIQSADDECNECDVVYGVTLIGESLCTFP